MELDFVLTIMNKEVTNSSWNSVSNVSNH